MAEGAVPSQWRTAVITPIPKVPKPTQAADYRPISITPVLSRSLEKYIVRKFIYPALQLPYPELCFESEHIRVCRLVLFPVFGLDLSAFECTSK